MTNKELQESRIGEVSYTKYGTKAIIKDYINCKKVLIEFQDKNRYQYYVEYKQFKLNQIENPYDKTIFGVGYVGNGRYKPTTKGKITQQYSTWWNMLSRCYDNKRHIEIPTYTNCCVCEEWHNFQIFAKWYDENIYLCGNEKMHLDKDILVKGNTIYSPKYCIFVPQCINGLFTKTNKLRGKYPIGVSQSNESNSYVVYCCGNAIGKRKYLGSYNTKLEAFNVYKNYKENLIKQVANYYKDKIPQNLYDALYQYEVEITD